jgi:uncharacterized membrane protein (DUF485 family)
MRLFFLQAFSPLTAACLSTTSITFTLTLSIFYQVIAEVPFTIYVFAASGFISLEILFFIHNEFRDL